MVELLPHLPPPPGAEEWEVGFSGSPESAERHVDVATDLDMTALAAHYGREIAAGGWTRTDGEATLRLGWSAWEREDETGNRLYLVWFAFGVPTIRPMFRVVEQVGHRQRGLPPWSWSRDQ